MADTSRAATPAGADHDHEVIRLFESCSVRDFRRWQLPCSELLAQSREESAYFVVARRGNSVSAPSSSARRCAISRRSQLPCSSCSRNRARNPPTSSSLAEETASPLPPPQHGGARFLDARSSLALSPPCLLTAPWGRLSQVRLVINDVPPEALHLRSELGGHHGWLSANVDRGCTAASRRVPLRLHAAWTLAK